MSLTSRAARLIYGWAVLALGFTLTFQVKPARAAAPPVTAFYEGTLGGQDIVDWTLWLGRSGSHVFGLTYGLGGPAPDDDLIGARMEGSIARNRLNLRVYPIVARNRRAPIGRITGKVTGNTVSGTFTMAGRRGTFTATLETADTPFMEDLAGSFDGETDAGDLTFDLTPDGRFTLIGHAFGEELFRATGTWLFTPDSQLWVMPVVMKGNNTFFDFTLKFKAPFALGLESLPGGFQVREPIRNQVIARFRER